MALNLVVNGITYRYPETGDQNWGQATTLWAQAVTSGMLQKAGGLFQLTANVDFGDTYGLISTFFTARADDTALTGQFRLDSEGVVAWRNHANTADLYLAIDSGDNLTFNGVTFITAAYTGITNANIDAAAAIALSKLAAMTANRAVVSDSSGFMVASAATDTEVGYLSGVTSAIQTQLNAKLALAGGTMTGSLILSGDPTLPLGAATKQYVDNASLGLQPKTACVVGTTGPGTLASSFENGDTIDGVVLATGDRILIKNQTNPVENGVYIVAASGAPSRATDMDTWAETIQAYILVTGGTVNAGTGWLSTIAPGGTIGVDPINFVQFSSSVQYTADGQGIELSGTIFSLELDGTTLSKSASGLRVSSTLVSTINGKMDNPLTTNGDMVTQAGGVPARVAIGSSGQVLTVSGGAPTWQTLPNTQTVQTVSGTLNLTSADSNKIFLIDTSSPRSVNLPSPSSGLVFIFKDKTGTCATNNITVNRFSSEQIEGVSASKILQTNWGSWKFCSDGTNWFIVA